MFSHGVPQSSVLGLILFTIKYMLPLANVIIKHSMKFDCYADETQLYLLMKPDQSNQLTQLQSCVAHIKSWMAHNFLLFQTKLKFY